MNRIFSKGQVVTGYEKNAAHLCPMCIDSIMTNCKNIILLKVSITIVAKSQLSRPFYQAGLFL